ncbi:MAG: hypothetical protein V8S33_14090 [Intestinibacter bartlettii]
MHILIYQVCATFFPLKQLHKQAVLSAFALLISPAAKTPSTDVLKSSSITI